MSLTPGTMTVDVLADGTVRAETGNMAGVSHQAADAFMKELARLLGGPVEVQKAERGHQHQHEHDHAHDHSHDHLKQ